MRYKAVHLLALFLMVYIGIEVTAGGIILFTYVVAQQKFSDWNSRMDRNILDAHSWRWAFVWLRFNWILWW